MSGDSAKQSVPSVHANGADIPCIGFGTYGISSADMLRLIPAALKTGFRHIDTAQIYGNEAEVGEGILRSGVPREDVFITTKVWVSNLPRRRFLASVDESLRNLRTDFIDLLLIHWPSNLVPLADQIGALNEVVHDGKVLNIGVSNFNRALVEQAVELSDIPLATNQFEYHPYLNQSTLLAATRRGGMSPTAYCVMAVGKVFTDPRLTYNKESWHCLAPFMKNVWLRTSTFSTSSWEPTTWQRSTSLQYLTAESLTLQVLRRCGMRPRK